MCPSGIISGRDFSKLYLNKYVTFPVHGCPFTYATVFSFAGGGKIYLAYCFSSSTPDLTIGGNLYLKTELFTPLPVLMTLLSYMGWIHDIESLYPTAWLVLPLAWTQPATSCNVKQLNDDLVQSYVFAACLVWFFNFQGTLLLGHFKRFQSTCSRMFHLLDRCRWQNNRFSDKYSLSLRHWIWYDSCSSFIVWTAISII